MFLTLGLNNDKCIHTRPLRSVPFHISPSLSLPQTLRLVCLVSLITKTKRIAECSATNCDTHTHTHRQSTVDMINRNIHILLIYAFIYICFGLFRFVSVDPLFVSVQSKHRNSLFRYRSETTETNVLFRIVPILVSVPVSVVSNRN